MSGGPPLGPSMPMSWDPLSAELPVSQSQCSWWGRWDGAGRLTNQSSALLHTGRGGGGSRVTGITGGYPRDGERGDG